MNRQFRADYLETSNAQILKIPYQGGEASMIVFSPKAGTTIEQLQKELTSAHFETWTHTLKQGQNVALRMPRFKFEASMSFTETLKKLGLREAFDLHKANLRNIRESKPDDENLYISDVLQKATCEVDETGTVATAATSVVVAEGGARPAGPNPILVELNHPFIFAIEARGVTIFLGRVMNPEP